MNSQHYSDVIMASQITSAMIVCSTVSSGADQRKLQSSAPLAFVRWIHRGLLDSPYNGPVTLKLFPFDDVIMNKNDILCHTYIMSILANKNTAIYFECIIHLLVYIFYGLFTGNGAIVWLNMFIEGTLMHMGEIPHKAQIVCIWLYRIFAT